jgi:hypothetical protein
MELQKVTDPEVLAALNAKTMPEEPKEKNVPKLVPVTDPEIIATVGLVPAITPEEAEAKSISSKETDALDSFGTRLPVFGAQVGLAETLLSLGSGAVGQVAGGMAGIFEAAGSGADSPTVTNVIENVQSSLTYQPRTQAGKAISGGVGEALAPVADAIISWSESWGDKAFDVTGSPEIATVLYTAPTALLEVLGLKGISRAKQFLPDNVQKVTQQADALRDPIRKFDSSVATVKLDDTGKLVNDPIGQKLVKLDFPETTTAVATNATKESKRIMNQMLDTFIKSKTNDVFALQEKVSSVVGKPIQARLNALQTIKGNLGKRLDKIADSELKNVEVTLEVPAANIAEQLSRNFGAALTVSKDGSMSLRIPKSSPLTNPEFKSTRNTINNMVNLVNSKVKNGTINGTEAHKTKRLLDEFVNSAKVSQSGITGNTMRLIADFRRSINDQLRQASPIYGRTNDRLSMIFETEAPFRKYVDLNKQASTAELVGSAMRNLTGDSVATKNLKADILRLDDTIKALGGNFKDEPLALLAFKDGIESFYKISDETLRDQMLGASRQQRAAMLDAVSSGAVGNVFGVAHDIKKLVNAGVNKKEAAKIVKNRAEVTRELKRALQ